jgi:uncharacterized protein YciI
MISCFDRPGAPESRQKMRSTHLGYLEGKVAQIKAGGAFLDGHDRPIGSWVIVEAADRSATEAFAYHRKGLFEGIEIRPRRAALGTWLG